MKPIEIMNPIHFNPFLMGPDVFGFAYARTSLRRKRNLLAKRGLLLTKQGNKRIIKGKKVKK
ncbi:MAG: hypothetical protein Q4C05_09270 [Akkermansia sp.]|nr:hypothetical protein [Akkermansia sp.]